MPNTYDIGDLVRSSATFAASGGTLTDPGQVWFLMIRPSGGLATQKYGLPPASIVRTGAGGYYIALDVASYAGDWHYRWEGTGNSVKVAEETTFTVRQTFKL